MGISKDKSGNGSRDKTWNLKEVCRTPATGVVFAFRSLSFYPWSSLQRGTCPCMSGQRTMGRATCRFALRGFARFAATKIPDGAGNILTNKKTLTRLLEPGPQVVTLQLVLLELQNYSVASLQSWSNFRNFSAHVPTQPTRQCALVFGKGRLLHLGCPSGTQVGQSCI